MKLAASRAKRRSPSLIPLIDVMLVLLFFFMLASATVQYGRTRVEFTMPSAQAARPMEGTAATGRVQEAFVGADGFITINGVRYNVPGAVPVLQALPAGTDLKLIPAAGLPLQTLLQLWERLRAEGIRSRLGEARISTPATAP
jgi:biopolymer transport protein ExbD